MISTIGGRSRSAWRAIQPSAAVDVRRRARRRSPPRARRRRAPRGRGGRGRGPGWRGRSARGRAKGWSTPGASLLASRPKIEVEGPAGGHGAAEMVGDRAGRGRIVRAVEPELGAPRAAGRGAGRGRAAAAGPASPPSPSPRASAASGTASAPLMAEHRHGERRVHRLMRAGEAGQRQVEAAVARRDNGAGRREISASQARAARQPQGARGRRPPSRDPLASALRIG